MVRTARHGIELPEGGLPTAALPLAGRRVFLVEDEALVAIDLEMTLEAAGAVVLGPFLNLRGAIAGLGGPAPDVAILDVVLGRDESYPLADVLSERGVPLVFHSGHARIEGATRRYPNIGWCPKPCSPATIVQTVARAIGD